MRSQYHLCPAGLVVAGAMALLSATSTTAATPASAPLEAQAFSTRPDALLSIDLNRSAVVERIIGSWSKEIPANQIDDLRAKLLGLRADHLLAANLSGSFDGVLDVLLSRSAAGNTRTESGRTPTVALDGLRSAPQERSKAVGELDRDLVYTPITPCRVLDTRPSQGGPGPRTSGSTTAFDAVAASFATQGGSATNCNIPQGAAAMAGSFAMLSASSFGFVTLWAVDTPQPTAATGLFNPTSQQALNSSSAIVPLCAAATCTGGKEFNVYVVGSTLDVTFDVTGYFMPPTRNGNGLRVSAPVTVAIGTSVNVVNGSNANNTSGGVSGGTISGGGTPEGVGANTVTGNFGTVGGGRANRAAFNATVGGGETNNATGFAATISGGQTNTVSGNFSALAGGSGGVLAGINSFIGSGGSGTGSTCYNHVTAASDAPCWNQIDSAANSAVISGGFNNRTNNFAATIGGGASNRVEQNDSTIAGGVANTITGANAFGATIGGGQSNTASNSSATVAGGANNVASGSGAFVGGGRSNVASGLNAAIAGGLGNLASGDRAVIAGGGSTSTNTCFNRATGLSDATCTNRAEGLRNFIGAGVANRTASDQALVAGGFANEASGSNSVVVGGVANTASGDRAVVVGGGSTSVNTCFNRATGLTDGPCQNIASAQRSAVVSGVGNLSSAQDSFIGGGSANHASGVRSVIGGGVANTALGFESVVPGGRGNESSGAFSFAAGRAAKTNDGTVTPTQHFGAFVWADSPDDGSVASSSQTFRSTASNQFAVRARGGVFFKTDNGTIAANAGDLTAGCSLLPGGSASWSCSSDRNLKEKIKAISPSAILAKVSALPLSTWQFKGTERRHLSPMAQDFWAAFGFGADDRHITASDVSGVALAAVQGVNEKLNAELKSLKAHNAKLERDLAAIRKKIGM